MKAAARVAKTFQIDPVMVLEERDPLAWAARVAAHNVVTREANEAQAEAARHRGVTGSRSPRKAGRR